MSTEKRLSLTVLFYILGHIWFQLHYVLHGIGGQMLLGRILIIGLNDVIIKVFCFFFFFFFSPEE